MPGTLIRGTATTGLVSTEGVLPEQKVVDMQPTIKMLDLETDQFTTMTDDIGSKATTREKFNWLEDEYAQKVVRLNAAATNVATSIVLNTAYKDFVKTNDTLRNLNTGEGLRVTAVNADGVTLTVVRGEGTRAAAAAIATTEDILITGSAFPQGSDIGDLSYQQRVLGYNYGQIFRTAWGFSGTEQEIEQYGGRDPAMEQAKKLIEHRNLIERSGFWGARAFSTANVNSPAPVGRTGGAYEFIVANNVDANGAITPDFVDQFLRNVYAYGSTDKVGYAHPLIGMAFSKFNRTGQGTYWEADPSDVHGVKVNGFISGAYGYKLPIVVKREWNSLSETMEYGACLFVIDMKYVSRRPTRNRDTKLLTNRQSPGVDGNISEYLTETGWEFEHERTHGLIRGVNSIAP